MGKSTHPPYADMIDDALLTVTDREYLSLIKIQKYLEEKHGLDRHTPSVKGSTKRALNKGLDNERYLQEKSSYRLAKTARQELEADQSSPEPEPPRKTPKKKPAAKSTVKAESATKSSGKKKKSTKA